jgi:hypothetical protein
VILTALASAATMACSSASEAPGGASKDGGAVTSCLPADSDAGEHPPLRVPPANPVGGFSIDLGDPSITVPSGQPSPIEVQPGGELFPCLVFPLNIEGSSRIVAGGMLTPSLGLHHGNITTRPSDGIAGIHPCPNVSWTTDIIGEEANDILAGGTVLFGSTTQLETEEWESFPCGMGFAVKDGYEIVAHMHYLNPSSQVVTPKPKYRWYTIDPKTVTQQLYPFAWELKNFSVPPHTQQTFTGSCATASPMHIVNVLPHMHQLGVGLDLSYLGGPKDGQAFLMSPGYDPNGTLQEQYTPAVDLSQGTGFSMSCAWNNTTDQTIVEGTGINEMCMIFGYAWPAAGAYSAVFSAGGTGSCFAIPAPAN